MNGIHGSSRFVDYCVDKNHLSGDTLIMNAEQQTAAMTVQQLIDLSTAEQRIVYADYTDERAAQLWAMSTHRAFEQSFGDLAYTPVGNAWIVQLIRRGYVW